MKLTKIQQLIPILVNLMECYNAFISVESLERKSEAWFEKLQWCDIDSIKIAIKEWDGTKMPTAVDIFKKCRETKHTSKNVSQLLDDDLICEYHKFTISNDECDISKSQCKNNCSEKNKSDFFKINVNGGNVIVCYWHNHVMQSKFGNDAHSKIFIDRVISFIKNEKIDPSFENNLYFLKNEIMKNKL